MKYAIKIPFDDGWLYATEYDMNDEFSIVVTTYDTREDAEGYAKLWNGSIVVEYNEEEVPCKTHSDAPHGFNRNASHSLGRYVCDCEFWEEENE